MVIGEVVIRREEAEANLAAWEHAEAKFLSGVLGQDRSGGQRRRGRVAARLAQQVDTDTDQEEDMSG